MTLTFTSAKILKITYTLSGDFQNEGLSSGKGIWLDSAPTGGSYLGNLPIQSAAKEYVIDVSGVTGKHGLLIGYWIGGSTTLFDMKIYKVELSQ